MLTNSLRRALIGLGSNQSWLGQSCDTVIRKAAEALGVLGANPRLSPLYRSPAWPDPSQPAYVNAVLALDTVEEPEALLAGLQAVEAAFGRMRSEDPALRYAPRTLDCDLLALGAEVRRDEALTLPHPRLGERDFVLLPLRDVAADFRHPLTGADADGMLASLATVTAERL